LSQVTWQNGAMFGIPGGNSESGGSTSVDGRIRQAPITFTAWITPGSRSDESSNDYSITPFPPNAVSGDGPAAFGFGLGLNVWTDGGGGSALSVESVGSMFQNGSSQFTADNQYFVVAAIGATLAQMYVNANLVASQAFSAPGAASPANLWLGLHNDDTGYGTKRFFVGTLQDVRIYTRELSAQDVTSLWTAGPAP
jgi:hypothetical protein